MKPNDSDEEECSEPVNSDEGMDHEQDNSDSDEDLKKSKFKKDNTQGHDSGTENILCKVGIRNNIYIKLLLYFRHTLHCT